MLGLGGSLLSAIQRKRGARVVALKAALARRRALQSGVLVACLVGCLQGQFAPAASGEPMWTTYHRDAGRSGNDPDAGEGTAPVEIWHSRDLGAPIWGQPVILGSTAYVATVGDVLYALDTASGNVVWEKSAGAPVPAGELPCGDITPTVGIVGTPVIDASAGTIYVVADTWDAGTKEAHHVLKGYRVANGEEVLSTAVDPPGADAKALLQRPGLTLDQGSVVFGMGGNDGDCSDYRGTAVAAPESGGAPRFWQVPIAPPSETGGAIWGVSGPVVDSEGRIYAATGNPNPPAGQQATTYDYSDSVVELDSSLNLIGHFEPPSWMADSNADLDLGSAGPELLPGGRLFQAGKNGTGYLIDEAGMSSGKEATYSHEVCGHHASFGGDAYAAGVIYVACTNGTQALAYEQQSAKFTPLWKGPSDANGPPILSGGLVWVVATGGGGGTKLYGLDRLTGAPRFTETLPSPVADHFASPSAAGGRLFVATGSSVTAYALETLTRGLPELGQCLKLSKPAKGRYSDRGCVTASAGEDTGRYEWQPLSGPRRHFAAASRITQLTTAAGVIVTCRHTVYAGEYTGLRTGTAAEVLTGCQGRAPAATQCQTQGASPGEIRTGALEGELGFVSGGSSPVVGWDLKPIPPASGVMSFNCGQAAFSVTGSVIARLTTIDRMTPRLKLKYVAAGGEQIPQQFEGGAKDTLTLVPSVGSPERVGLTATIPVGNGSPLEIKAAP
jgi:outer membrane protein assembly factor BamB